jgi:hypothetical protein
VKHKRSGAIKNTVQAKGVGRLSDGVSGPAIMPNPKISPPEIPRLNASTTLFTTVFILSS